MLAIFPFRKNSIIVTEKLYNKDYIIKKGNLKNLVRNFSRYYTSSSLCDLWLFSKSF